MKKLFALIFVGLCAQSFCMHPEAPASIESVVGTKEQRMIEALNRLSDYFAQNDTDEIPVASPAQAFEEMRDYIGNKLTFDREQASSTGRMLYHSNIDSQSAENEYFPLELIAGLQDLPVNDSDVESDETVSRHPAALTRLYGASFGNMCDLYNAIVVFMQHSQGAYISEAQRKMISRVWKGIQHYGDICIKTHRCMERVLRNEDRITELIDRLIAEYCASNPND